MGKPVSLGLDWFRFFLVQNPQWAWTTLTSREFELLWNQSIEQYGAVIGTDDPDLTRFRDRGGKVIIYHGRADEVIPAEGTIDYYERMQHHMGGRQPTAEFARLFLVPGADHGFATAAPSPTITALMDAIIGWVENGRVPDRIAAELRGTAGKVIQTRPLYPYPQIAR
jgi:feruloyl esterase